MKKLIIGLLALGSISSFATDIIITIETPRVRMPGGLIGELRHIDLSSDKDGVCRYFGADEYVKGSIKKSKSIQLLGCDIATFSSDRFSTINSDGVVIENYKAKTYETLRSKLKRHWACIEYKTRKYQIDEIKCIKY